MKRILIIASTLLFVVLSIATVRTTQTKIVSSTPFTSGYAKVTTNDCYLLKSPDEESRLFLLEQSYFVKVVEDFSSTLFKVEYMEFEGYVKKSQVSFVEEFPQNPYLNGITFDIYDISNVCLRSTPETLDTDENIVCTIKVSSKDLLYFGKCIGEEAVKGLGNIWYYCAYQNEHDEVFKGYIYSAYARNLSAITSSGENLTVVNVSNFVPVDSLLYLNLSTKNLLIVISIIPTIFVVWLFTKQGKVKTKD